MRQYVTLIYILVIDSLVLIEEYLEWEKVKISSRAVDSSRSVSGYSLDWGTHLAVTQDLTQNLQKWLKTWLKIYRSDSRLDSQFTEVTQDSTQNLQKWLKNRLTIYRSDSRLDSKFTEVTQDLTLNIQVNRDSTWKVRDTRIHSTR